MRVSVVIPTYNSATLTAETVASVLAQTAPADQILVVDDGSTDDTAQRIRSFGSPVRYLFQHNAGPSAARNRGVSAATGEWVAFLDGDDVWHPRKLELQKAALARRPDLVLLGHRTYDWPGTHPEIVGRPDAVFAEVNLDDLLIRNAFVTSTLLVRTEALRAAGPFDPELRGPEDYDMWLRVARLGTVANLSLALTGYRSATPGSLSKNAERMEQGMRRILEKQERAGAFRGRPMLRRKAWGYFRYTCGYMHHLAGNRWKAFGRLVRSISGYPFGYSRADVRYRFGRCRLLLKSLLGSAPPPERAAEPRGS